MEDAMRCIRLLALPLAACAASAFAGALEDAKGLLDKRAAADCELLMMHYEASTMPLSSEARNGVIAQMKSRLAERERDGVSDRLALDSVRADLTAAERVELARHGMTLYSQCAARAEATYHVHLPAVPKDATPQLKAAPYAPPLEKSTLPSVERPAALQSSPVDR
jgi:hypothetical protein